MSKQPTVTTVASGFQSQTAINTNFTNIKANFDNFLSLNGETPNAMEADLDMNSNDILNVKELGARTLRLNGTLFTTSNVTAIENEGVFQTKASATATDITDDFDYVITLEDGAVWKRSAATSFDHDGWFRDNASTGDYWELVNNVVTPEMFGAAGDDSTDDSTAFTQALAFCRAKQAILQLGGKTYFVGSTTLYGGGTTIIGNGAPKNRTWDGSKSIIRSNANPILTTAISGSNTSFVPTVFKRFVLQGSGNILPASGVALWDNASNLHQIGLWVGTSHEAVSSDSDAEGGGADLIEDITVQDCGKAGIYLYRSFGRTSLIRPFVRACGGDAALAAADNDEGAAIWITASVDIRIYDPHVFSSPHLNTDANAWGCGLRVDDPQDDVDADFTWESSANLHFYGTYHSEGYPKFLVNNGKDLYFETINFNPGDAIGGDGTVHNGEIDFGDASSASNNGRIFVQMLRLNKVKDINISELMEFRADLITVGSPGLGKTRLNYWGQIEANFDPTAVLPYPRKDRANQPGGTPSTTAVAPILLGAIPYATDVEETLLPSPSLHTDGSAYSSTFRAKTAYVSSNGSPIFNPDSVRLSDGSSTAQEFEIDVFDAARLDGYDQVLSGASPVANGKIRLFQNKTTTAVTTYTTAAMDTANADPLVADGSGNLGEIFAPPNLYTVKTYDASDNVLTTADNVMVGEPMTAGFWIDAGAHTEGDVTFGIRNAAGTEVMNRAVRGTFPVNGREQFVAYNFWAPYTASGGDSRYTLFFRNEASNLMEIHPFLLRGLLPYLRRRSLPAAWPSTLGWIPLANPTVMLRATAAWNPASIADNGQATNDFTVTGAKVGDFVTVAPGVDVTDLDLSYSVTADDTVTVVLTNNTGGAVDLANSTWAIQVMTR